MPASDARHVPDAEPTFPSGRVWRSEISGTQDGTVNYEDRTDLLPPEQVISAGLLSKLRQDPDAAGSVSRAAADPTSAAVSPSAGEAIVQRVAEDTAPDRGAPEQARAIEEDAMLCGYRFGRLVVGPPPQGRVLAPVELRRRTDSMYLYDLFISEAPTPDLEAPVTAILARHDEHGSAFDEAIAWAWSFGLGLALVEADHDSAEHQSGMH
jgi:hypothetical protein